MRLTAWTRLLALMVSSVLATAAHAQWTVTYLHPAGGTTSSGRGVSGLDQAGYAVNGPTPYLHAALWTGSAASYVDLNPAVAITSRIEGTDGAHQVGSYMLIPAVPGDLIITRAAIWSGTAASFVNLHPALAPQDQQASVAVATEGNLQTGRWTLYEDAPTHAAKWNGTAASFTDIHPTGYKPGFTALDFSSGIGTDGASIVGEVHSLFATAPPAPPERGQTHAGLWTFAPDTFTDLHPETFVKSIANDVEGGIQVGNVGSSKVAGSPTRAAIWSGTAASFVDVNPAGATSSTLNGVDGGFQVGTATLSGINGAGIWSGTAGSFINLHSFLTPGTYNSSEARSVWTDGTTIKVIGTAFNTSLARNEAVLWTVIVPEPMTLFALPAIGLVAMCYRRRKSAPR